MNWKIISLIFALFIICVPIASAQVLTDISIKDGVVVTKTVTDATIHKGDVYTLALGAGSPPIQWNITSSSGLQLQSSSSSGERKFLAISTGKQQITAESRSPSAIQNITTIINVV